MFKNLSISALGVSGHQSEIIELALTFGFQSIDIDIEDFATRAKLHGMPYARRLIDSAKLRIGAFQLPFDWEAEEDIFNEKVGQLGELAKFAAEIGCKCCTATVAPAGDKLPYHENFEFHKQRFGKICETLAPAGVRFGIGFRAAADLRKNKEFQFIHEVDALSLLLNMVGESNIGMVLDIWNLYVAGESTDNVRNTPIDQIVAVQLADAPDDVSLMELSEESRLLPGETGRLDIPATLAMLASMGYEGPVTPVPHRNAFTSDKRDIVVKMAGKALDAVWKDAGLDVNGKLIPKPEEDCVA